MSMMIGPLLLFAAVQSAQLPAVEGPTAAKFVPATGATVRAQASVRFLAAAKFGPGRSEEAPGALRRKAHVTDQLNQPRPAILLEFQ
jgi:hypothetical protein